MTCYTLTRPALGYDESETTYAVFATREGAEAARQEIIARWKAAKATFGDQPDDEDEGYDAWWDNFLNGRQLNSPFVPNDVYLHDILGETPESAVVIVELPFYP